MNCQNKAEDMMMKIEIIILEIWSRFHGTFFIFFFPSYYYLNLGGGQIFFLMEKEEINMKREKIVMTFVLAVYEKNKAVLMI